MSARANPWLLGDPGAASTPALICIPHAGGNAAAFASWTGRLGPGVRVLAVQLPGHGARAAERPLTSIPDIVDELVLGIARDLPETFAMYGHSFGALVGYEVARLMSGSLGRAPIQLVVGACRPPDALLDRPPLHAASDDRIVEYLASMSGTADELTADPAVRALVLPGVRADLEALETYRHVPGAPVRVPITAIAGADDASLRPAEMRGWAHHTASPFRLATVPGSHFFLRTSRAAVLDVIVGAFRPTVAT